MLPLNVWCSYTNCTIVEGGQSWPVHTPILFCFTNLHLQTVEMFVNLWSYGLNISDGCLFGSVQDSVGTWRAEHNKVCVLSDCLTAQTTATLLLLCCCLKEEAHSSGQMENFNDWTFRRIVSIRHYQKPCRWYPITYFFFWNNPEYHSQLHSICCDPVFDFAFLCVFIYVGHIGKSLYPHFFMCRLWLPAQLC